LRLPWVHVCLSAFKYVDAFAEYRIECLENVFNAIKFCVECGVMSPKTALSIEKDLGYECTEFDLQINDVWYTVIGDELFSSWDKFVEKIKSILGKSS
jgi:hypothetical protein